MLRACSSHEYNVNHMAAAMAELLNDQGRAAAMG